MVRVVDCCYESTGRPGFICDFSPPRSGNVAEACRADLPADFISVAYNPGRAVCTNSAMLAATIRQETGKGTIFTLATRDMNRLAIQSLLLGAQILGLEKRGGGSGRPLQRTRSYPDKGCRWLPPHRAYRRDSRHERRGRLAWQRAAGTHWLLRRRNLRLGARNRPRDGAGSPQSGGGGPIS